VQVGMQVFSVLKDHHAGHLLRHVSELRTQRTAHLGDIDVGLLDEVGVTYTGCEREWEVAAGIRAAEPVQSVSVCQYRETGPADRRTVGSALVHHSPDVMMPDNVPSDC
jgi:hypothetical protein